MTLKEMREAFKDLEDTINSNEPTVERVREWAGILAGLCGHLAQRVDQIGDACPYSMHVR